MKYYKFKVAKINSGTPSHYIARFESAENGIEVFEAENAFGDFSVVSISNDDKATDIENKIATFITKSPLILLAYKARNNKDATILTYASNKNPDTAKK